jgi:tRNA A-37 threonylcarbamoyl transferase component Bud32
VGQRSVGRYEVLRVIGRGGMAIVYLATQTDLRRQVALKELMVTDDADPRAARRFLREARLVGGLSHPNIVTVHDYFEYAAKPYIAMEYLSRGSLRPHIGRLSLPQIGGVLTGMLAGLAHAGRHDVVHRDLKPENVMITGEGAVKIADFGIAKATRVVRDAAPNLTATGTTLGTPNYIAPEQAMARELCAATDLYSLGVMAWEMFVGRVPFADTREPVAVAMRQVNDPIPPVDTVNPQVDPSLADWIARLLVKDPRERTDSATAAADELEEILITLLGARWRRDAPLPEQPGARAAVVATPSRARTAALAGAGAGALAGASVGTGSLGLTLPPRAAVAAAATPATNRLEPAAPPHKPRAGTIALALLAMAGLIALFSGLLSGPKERAPTPTAPASSTSTPPAVGQPQPAQQPEPAQQPQPAPPAPQPEAPAAPAPAAGTPAAPTGEDESGVGDSQSDDPSDDEPEGGGSP